MKKRARTKTLLPAFDPRDLGEEVAKGAIEARAGQFDPAEYARIVEGGSLRKNARVPRVAAIAHHDLGRSLADTVGPPPASPRTQSTVERASVLRLRAAELFRPPERIPPRASGVLSHIDGVCDAEEIAFRSGIPREEALERLQMLLNLGIVEVVR